MKQLLGLSTAFFASCLLTAIATAGPEALPGGKEMKQVAPAPPPACNWTGFYLGVHVGGQFGHAEDKDLDDYNALDQQWGYSVSGVVAGGQIGYNWQWNWLVLGPEIDVGYMNLDGSGTEPESIHFSGSDTHGHSDSDFYATFRGRIGVAIDQWLFYATGGGIGVNWETRVVDDCNVFPCGPGLTNAHEEDLDWGWTVGGGIERMIGCHWSIKAEYLFYELDDQHFSAANDIFGRTTGVFGWRADDQGHIIRGGLNYKF
jgi:outer membrane immunogenic protein